MNEFAWLWLSAVVLFAVVEAATVALVSLWFLGGALVAFVASLLGAALWLQALLFLLVSAGLILCLRPFAKKFIQPRITSTNFDRIIGMQAPVVERIDNLEGSGAIKVEGNVWSARSEAGNVIEEGAVVEIVKIQGVKVYVKSI